MTLPRNAEENSLKFSKKALIFSCVLGQKSGLINRPKFPLAKTKWTFNSGLYELLRHSTHERRDPYAKRSHLVEFPFTFFTPL